MLWQLLRYIGAPEPSNEETRAKIVDESGLMESKRDPDLDRLTTLVWSRLGCTLSQITVVNRNTNFIRSQVGDIEDYSCVGFPKSYSFCSWTFLSPEEHEHEVLVIENLAKDSRFADNPAGTSSCAWASLTYLRLCTCVSSFASSV